MMIFSVLFLKLIDTASYFGMTIVDLWSVRMVLEYALLLSATVNQRIPNCYRNIECDGHKIVYLLYNTAEN